jgi:hypothetical protein
MKKYLNIIFIALLTISLTSCGSVPMTGFDKYGYTNGWIYRDIPPSQVVTNGDMFFEDKLSDGRTFSVGGYIGDPDSTYYYNSLWQDLGWYLEKGTWSTYTGHRPKRGHLYINIKRGVAIYFYAEKKFNAFKVTINPKEDN